MADHQDNTHRDRFEILRALTISGVRGDELKQTVATALAEASALVGLSAAAVYLWKEGFEISLSVTHAVDDAHRKTLLSLEKSLFATLRHERGLTSAYLSFGGDAPAQSFTLPLRHGKTIFGAVIGLQDSEHKLISEDYFLEAFSGAVALNVIADGLVKESGISKEMLDKERLSAIIELAVTVNHEINNPLTAILGNVQLLLLKRADLDPELQAKLKTIEVSAMRIRDVTQKLLRLTSVKSKEYAEGTSMLDLGDGERE